MDVGADSQASVRSGHLLPLYARCRSFHRWCPFWGQRASGARWDRERHPEVNRSTTLVYTSGRAARGVQREDESLVSQTSDGRCETACAGATRIQRVVVVVRAALASFVARERIKGSRQAVIGRRVRRASASRESSRLTKRPFGARWASALTTRFLLTVETETGTRGGRLPSREQGESSSSDSIRQHTP